MISPTPERIEGRNPNKQQQHVDIPVVLFVCTANALRSQMAEGWAELLYPQQLAAFSAGVRPVGWISRKAVKVMAEVGIDISHHYSKGLEEFKKLHVDLVVTLSQHAYTSCNGLAAHTKFLHIDVHDPTGMIGRKRHILKAYRTCRDQLRTIVEQAAERLNIV